MIVQSNWNTYLSIPKDLWGGKHRYHKNLSDKFIQCEINAWGAVDTLFKEPKKDWKLLTDLAIYIVWATKQRRKHRRISGYLDDWKSKTRPGSPLSKIFDFAQDWINKTNSHAMSGNMPGNTCKLYRSSYMDH